MIDQRRGTEKESRSGSEPIVLPNPAKPPAGQDSPVLLAMCIFGEARGEDQQTRQAVAQTVINRAKHPHRVFGSRRWLDFTENLRRVILQPKQFSSFNPDDPNYSKLLRPLEYEEPSVWEQCLRCAQETLTNKDNEDTLTANSDHYFDDSIQPPAWADPAKQTVKIGRLNFYRIYLPPLKGSVTAGTKGPAASRAGVRFPAATASPLPSRRGTGSVVVKAPLEPSPAAPPTPGGPGVVEPMAQRHRNPSGAGSRPHTSLPASAHATVRTIGLSQHRWEIRGGWLTSLALVVLSLTLAGCTDFERTAYRTLAVTQVEYETLQEEAVEAALQGLLTDEQWDRFATAGHRFIHAHNAAVDAFALWSQTKSKKDAARLEAMLEMLPRLIQEINELVQSFEQSPPAPSFPDPEKENTAPTTVSFGNPSATPSALLPSTTLRAGRAWLGTWLRTSSRHNVPRDDSFGLDSSFWLLTPDF